MEDLLTTNGYSRMGLSSNIILYYSGHIWDRGYEEKEYLNELFRGCEDLYQVESILKGFYKHDGDINIIAYDIYTQEILIYIDPIGTRPLYINDKNFLSPSINDLINKDSELDYQYLGQIRWFGYNQNDLTPWKNIKRLLPGFMYKGNVNTLFNKITHIKLQTKINTGWMLPLYLEESVMNRLNSVEDKVIGVLLSGGLDSSVISALLVRCNERLSKPKKLRFFTTENAEDMKYAKEVAKFLGIKLEVIPGDDVELLEDEIFDVNETPVDLGSVIPNMKLFKRISSMGIKTIFTGDGPDEMFRGYRRNAETDFDYHESDMKNELVFYHFPKLEKASRYYGIDLVTPYITPNIWNMAQEFKVDIYKKDLKNMAHGLIPESVIDRLKEPLKNNDIRDDKVTYQHEFLNRFISYALKKGESIQTTKK